MIRDIININVVQKTINEKKKRFVNARELHKWLESKRQFANWIKDRIEKYDFRNGLDYFKIIPQKELQQAKDFDLTNLLNQKPKRGGDVKSIEYILSIDMAKAGGGRACPQRLACNGRRASGKLSKN